MESPETVLETILRSPKTKKTAIILTLAGIGICVYLLLPPVQKFFASHAAANASLPFAALVVLVFALCCLYAKNICAFLEKAGEKRLFLIFLASLILTGICFTGIYAYHYGHLWLDSDHASEMVLGKHLADNNVLVSTGWYYSTELRIIYQTLFTMPLFKMLGAFENWALIRSINIMLNIMVLLLSYAFLMKQFKIPLKWILITCLFFIMPLSYDYWHFVLFGGYYIFFIAQFFICLGLFYKLTLHKGTVKQSLPAFVLFSLLSLMLGVQGIRALFAFYIPLLAACAFMRGEIMPKKKAVFLSIFGLACCCAGYVINFLLRFSFSVTSYDKMLTEYPSNFLQKIGLSLMNLAGFFGYSAGTALISAQGFLGLSAIAAACFLLWAVYKSSRFEFLPLFFLTSAACNIFTFVIVDQPIVRRYFILFMIFYIPLAAVLFNHTEKKYIPIGNVINDGFWALKRTAIICGIALFVISQGLLNFKNFTENNANETRQGCINYMLENQLEFGFATFWNANIITELTNGRVEIAGLEPGLRAARGK
ncbi:MAG: hypothetical protein FWH41_04405, partial [Treponema sp.]|nr:hypothetical protein [Treponema sp.]